MSFESTRNRTPSGTRGMLTASLACAAAFKEEIAIWIEKVTLARRDAQGSVAAAAIDQPEQCEQLRPRAKALIHGVWVAAIVDSQPLIQPRDRVIVREDLDRWKAGRGPRHRERKPFATAW